MAESASVIPIERIASRIYLIRGEKVMLDSDLAKLYGVTTARLNEQFKRNLDRFPADFAFQLNAEEARSLRSQLAILKSARRGQHRKYRPYAFTEHGVAMLSSVLRSKRAIQVNVAIVRTFIELRRVLASNRDLARKVEQHDRQIAVLFDTVRKLLTPPDPPKKNPIGYVHHAD
ncbi:MAG: ORF6N domain-containing protein [Candidatus Binataceae bacterium]